MAKNSAQDFTNRIINSAEIQLFREKSGIPQDELIRLLKSGYRDSNLESLGIDGKPESIYGEGSKEEQYTRAVTQGFLEQEASDKKIVRLLAKAHQAKDPEVKDALLSKVRQERSIRRISLIHTSKE